MAFECDTPAAAINPQQHYNNCTGALGLAWAIFNTEPPFQIGVQENDQYDMFTWLLGQIGWGCTAAWNEIEAAGAGPNYNPDWLAELREVCAVNFQPSFNSLNTRLSNDPNTAHIFWSICSYICDFYDPINVGFPAPVNPFPQPLGATRVALRREA